MYTYSELGISKKFSIINQNIRHMFDAAFIKSGLTGTQAAVLHFIFAKGKYDDIYQRDIESEFNIRRSSVTSVLQGLERGGFIRRVSVQEDSRLKKIVITDKAIEITEQIQQSIDGINQSILKGLSTDETKLLSTLLTRIGENLP